MNRNCGGFVSLDISTADGANEFLRYSSIGGGFRFISSLLDTANAIRAREKKLERLNASERRELTQLYFSLYSLASNSVPKLFRETVPEREISALFNHSVQIFQQKTTDDYWIRTGELPEHDYTLLASHAALFSHPVPVAMVFEETKFLETISMMLRSSNNLPSVEIGRVLVFMVSNLLGIATGRDPNRTFDNPWGDDKFFKKLEASGILEQYLRCAAIPQTKDDVGRPKRFVFQELQKRNGFIKKRLKEGTPCGDTLRAIVAKRDGRNDICHIAFPFLQTLIQLSTLHQIGDSRVELQHFCQNCRTSDYMDTFMICGKCKMARYCCKDCQKADWKIHKHVCSGEVGLGLKKYAPVSITAVRGIVEMIYPYIMVRMVEECKRAGGLRLCDMLIEMDLRPNDDGRIPLLQDPPQFEIVPVSRYLDGSRPKDIDCPTCFTNTKNANAFSRTVVAIVNKVHSRSSRDDGPIGLRLGCRDVAIDTLQIKHPCNEKLSLFTQDAVDAFEIAMTHDDYSQLSEILINEEQVEWCKSYFGGRCHSTTHEKSP